MILREHPPRGGGCDYRSVQSLGEEAQLIGIRVDAAPDYEDRAPRRIEPKTHCLDRSTLVIGADGLSSLSRFEIASECRSGDFDQHRTRDTRTSGLQSVENGEGRILIAIGVNHSLHERRGNCFLRYLLLAK